MINTPWKYTIEFINSLEDNTIFNTTEQLHYVRNKKNVKPNTLYWHRIILKRLGFLEQTNKIGKWLKIKDFPYDIGKAKAERIAFSKKNYRVNPEECPKLKYYKKEWPKLK